MFLSFRPQELCESGGGRPGLLVPNSPYCLSGRTATFQMKTKRNSSFRRAQEQPELRWRWNWAHTVSCGTVLCFRFQQLVVGTLSLWPYGWVLLYGVPWQTETVDLLGTVAQDGHLRSFHSCPLLLGVNLSPEFVNCISLMQAAVFCFFRWQQRQFEFQPTRVAVEGRSNVVLNMHAQLQISLSLSEIS